MYVPGDSLLGYPNREIRKSDVARTRRQATGSRSLPAVRQALAAPPRGEAAMTPLIAPLIPPRAQRPGARQDGHGPPLPVVASAKLPTRVPGQGLHRRNRSPEARP